MGKRIELTQFEEIEARIKQCQKGFYPAEDLLQELAHHAPSLLAELKRMYEWKDEIIAEVKDLITYDQEDEMWVYDESKSSNPGLDAMDILINLAYD